MAGAQEREHLENLRTNLPNIRRAQWGLLDILGRAKAPRKTGQGWSHKVTQKGPLPALCHVAVNLKQRVQGSQPCTSGPGHTRLAGLRSPGWEGRVLRQACEGRRCAGRGLGRGSSTEAGLQPPRPCHQGKGPVCPRFGPSGARG